MIAFSTLQQPKEYLEKSNMHKLFRPTGRKVIRKLIYSETGNYFEEKWKYG